MIMGGQLKYCTFSRQVDTGLMAIIDEDLGAVSVATDSASTVVLV